MADHDIIMYSIPMGIGITGFWRSLNTNLPSKYINKIVGPALRMNYQNLLGSNDN